MSGNRSNKSKATRSAKYIETKLGRTTVENRNHKFIHIGTVADGGLA